MEQQNKQIGLNWFGSISQGQGYSGSGELMAVHLAKLGVDIRTVGFSKINHKNLTRDGRLFRQLPFKKFNTALCYGLPVSFNSMCYWKHKIGFTMFETDRLPTEKVWAGITGNPADPCNDLDVLVVPCEHNKKLFRDSGVTKPIEIVRLGYDPEQYRLIHRPRKRKVFTFLQSGNLSIRKNPGAVLTAFLQLFGGRKDVQLIIKTAGGSLGLGWEFPVDNIKIIDSYMTPKQMEALYHKADCFVFPSRGEGFGLPPIEAMATGLPVIMAKNTGMADYADDRYMYVIEKHKLTPAKGFPKEWGNVGNWYDPDYDELKRLMMHAYSNQSYSYDMGVRAAEWVKQNFTYTQTAKQLYNIISKHID